MAKYTMEYNEVLTQVDNAKIFGDFTTFDPKHKEHLIEKINDHFYFREIGFETVNRFCQRVRQHMSIRMPYFNDLYAVANIRFEPLVTSELRKIDTEKAKQDAIKNVISKNVLDSETSERKTANTDYNDRSTLDTDLTGTDLKMQNARETRELDTTDEKDFDSVGTSKTVTSGTSHNDTKEDSTAHRTVDTDTDANSTTDTTRAVERELDRDRNTDGNKKVDGTLDRTTAETGSGTSWKGESDTPQENLGAIGLQDPLQLSRTERQTNSDKKDGTVKDITSSTEKSDEKMTDHNHEEIDETVGVSGKTKSKTNSVEDSEQHKTGSANGTTSGKADVDTTSNQHTDEKGTENELKINTYDHDIKTTGTQDTETTKISNEKQAEARATDAITEGNYTATEGNTRFNFTDFESIIKGRENFSPTALIVEYRNAIINIDEMIIDSLEKYFLGVLI